MSTKDYNKNISTDLNMAIELLRSGELVSFPTETVYGLGADARNPEAVKKVFQVKGRPANHPLIVHLAGKAHMSHWAADIPDSAWVLAQRFWPGPLTLVLRKNPDVNTVITGGQDTIAIRMPNHRLTLELLQKFDGGLVGPSANKYGRVSPTHAEHVAADLGDEVKLILNGGACNVGIESTILNLCNKTPTIMRAGSISAQQIELALGCSILINDPDINTEVRVPGSDKSHYAPRTPVWLLSREELIMQANVLHQLGQKFSVLSFMPKPHNFSSDLLWQQAMQDPVKYAHDLYANLRAHDQLDSTAILIEQPPVDDSWQAINDRLNRASA